MIHFRIYPGRRYGVLLLIIVSMLSLTAYAAGMGEIAPHYHYKFGLGFEAFHFFQYNLTVFIIALSIVLITTFFLIYMEYLHIFWRIVLFTLLIAALVICAHIALTYIANKELSTALITVFSSINE